MFTHARINTYTHVYTGNRHTRAMSLFIVPTTTNLTTDTHLHKEPEISLSVPPRRRKNKKKTMLFKDSSRGKRCPTKTASAAAVKRGWYSHARTYTHRECAYTYTHAHAYTHAYATGKREKAKV